MNIFGANFLHSFYNLNPLCHREPENQKVINYFPGWIFGAMPIVRINKVEQIYVRPSDFSSAFKVSQSSIRIRNNDNN